MTTPGHSKAWSLDWETLQSNTPANKGSSQDQAAWDQWDTKKEEDKPSSLLKKIGGGATAWLVGGTSDTIGSLPAGIGGITALVSGAGSEEAAQVVEAISGKWRKEITEPLLEWVGPEKETRQAEEWIQDKFTTGLDGAAWLGLRKFKPISDTIDYLGYDSTPFKAYVDAASRAAAVAAMLALGVRRAGAGGKGISSAEVAKALDSGARESTQLALIKAESEGVLTPQQTLELRARTEPPKQLTQKAPIPDQMGAPKRLEDRSTTPRLEPLEGEYLPTESTKPLPELSLEKFTDLTESPGVKGTDPATRRTAYVEYLNNLDDINVSIQSKQRALGEADTITLTRFSEQEVAISLFQNQADVAALMKEGLSGPAARAEAAGHASIRATNLIAEEAVFARALTKLVEHPQFLGKIARLPEKQKIQLQNLLQRLEEKPAYGTRLDALQTKLDKLTDRPTLNLPKDVKPSPKADLFSLREKLTLRRELVLAKEAARIPGKGLVIRHEGMGPVGELAVKKFGQAGEEGIVSPRGVWYSPEEALSLRQVVDSVLKEDGPITAAGLRTLADEKATIAKFKDQVSPKGKHFGRQTLADVGIRPKKRISRDETLAESMLGVGRRGPKKQRGSILPGSSLSSAVQNLMNLWKKKDLKPRKEHRSRKGKVSSQETPLMDVFKEAVGGKALGRLHRRASENMAEGRFELAKVVSMLDQIPKAQWHSGLGNIKSWYQIRTQKMGELIASTTSPFSLGYIFKKHGAKLGTGVRRYMGKLPGGLTRQRMSWKLNKKVYADLMSDSPAQTALGKDLRTYADRLYRLSEQAGIETATYLKNYYPIVLKSLGKTERTAFIETAKTKGATEGQARYILDVALDGEGLVNPAKRAGPKAPKDPHLVKARTFFAKWKNSDLAPFLVDDVGTAFTKYGQAVMRNLANAERWGPDGQKWKAAMESAISESQEMGSPLTNKDVRLLENSRAIIDHTYMTAHKTFTQFAKAGIALENAAKLGLVVAGSVAEIGVGLLNATFQKSYVKALGTEVVPGLIRGTARAIWRDVEKTRAAEWAENIGRSVDAELHDLLTATQSADIQNTFSNVVFQINGLTTFTNMLQNVNVAAFEGALRQTLTKEANIRLGRAKRTGRHDADVAMLDYYGVTMDTAMNWYREGMKMDGSIYTNEISSAMIKYLNDTVMAPRGVNMPRWQSVGYLAPFRHLMTYVTVFGNTIVPDLAFQWKGGVMQGAPSNLWVRGTRGAQAMGGLAAIYGLALLSEEVMDLWKFGGSQESPMRENVSDDTTWMTHRLAKWGNRTGLYGFMGSRAFDLYERSAYKSLTPDDVYGGFVGASMVDLVQAGLLAAGAVTGDTSPEKVGKFLAGITPMASAMPRTYDVEGMFPSKERLAEGYARFIEELVP